MDELNKRAAAGEEELERKQVILTPTQLVMKRFIRNKLAIAGLAVLVFMIIFCFLGPIISPLQYKETELFYYDPVTHESIRMSEKDKLASAYLDTKAKPSLMHPLGTDQGGMDMMTRLMYGGRVSLLVGLCVVFVELVIGVALGGIAGYYGGKIDMIIMRLVEVFYSVPFIPLMLILSSIMISLKISPQYKIYYIMFVMGVLYWAGVARMIRGNILSLREMEYMQAAEALGIRTSRKIFRHLIPNVMPLIIVMATMDLGSIILIESTMSFLGVGVAAPYASWGNMVQAVTDRVVMQEYLNIWVPPGLCILITVLAFNFVGDGLRDAFDPRMRR